MRGRGRRGRGAGPRGRRGGAAGPRERRPRTSEYDPMDLAEIKAMLVFYMDTLSKYPRQAPELLRKVAVADEKKEEEIRVIIASAFTGGTIPADKAAELCSDLMEINEYANKSKADLRLKSNLKYNPDDIAKMVHDVALESVLEKQELQPVHQVVLVELGSVDKPKEEKSTEEKPTEEKPEPLPVPVIPVIASAHDVNTVKKIEDEHKGEDRIDNANQQNRYVIPPRQQALTIPRSSQNEGNGLGLNGPVLNGSPVKQKKPSFFVRLSHLFQSHKKEDKNHDNDNHASQRFLN